MYQEVIDIQPTPDQDLGLTIAYKTFVNALRFEQDPPPPPPTAGAFFALEVLRLLEGYARDNVSAVKTSRVDDAFAQADSKTQAQVAALLNVNIVITPPTDPVGTK